MTFLCIYLGGVALRAFLAHGLSQNPNVKELSLNGQFLGCVCWPFFFITYAFRSI